MQTQQPKQTQHALPQTDTAQAKVSPQPWAKPTFERVPLNEALASFTNGGTDAGQYTS